MRHLGTDKGFSVYHFQTGEVLPNKCVLTQRQRLLRHLLRMLGWRPANEVLALIGPSNGASKGILEMKGHSKKHSQSSGAHCLAREKKS